MAEIINLGTRRVSGTGQIIIEEENLNYRRYTLYADIIRKQRTPYFNRNYEPPQTFYGYISLMKQGYLLQTLPIKYDAQIWIFDADISGQNLVAIKCAYLGILETFFNLGNSLNLPSLSVENTIAEYKYLPLPWDNILIKCDGECAIQFNLSALPYDACEDDYKMPADNPTPPTKPTPVQPGTGTTISPAYEGDEITDPAQIDKDYIPTPCITVIRGSGLNSDTCGSLGNFGDYSYNGYAELFPVNVPPNNCSGLRVFLDGVDLGVGQTYYTDAIILSRTGNCIAPGQ